MVGVALPSHSVPVVHVDDLLVNVMARAVAEAGIRILGIDGPSGSGKSTLAARLAARSGAPLITIDVFRVLADFAGWWPRLERQVLTRLLSGG
jgi:pantothenate kinase-related protein Tda10